MQVILIDLCVMLNAKLKPFSGAEVIKYNEIVSRVRLETNLKSPAKLSIGSQMHHKFVAFFPPLKWRSLICGITLFLLPFLTKSFQQMSIIF